MPLDLTPHPVARRCELTLGPTGPWKAVTTVWVVQTNHGRHSTRPTDYLFEVQTEWTGPPLPDFPASDGPVNARDVISLDTLEAARELAYKADFMFRNGGDHAPDLRRLAA